MKHTLFLLLAGVLTACSSIIPYKDQNLDYLYSIQEDPSAYKGAVVAFNGDVVGIRENNKSIRLILRIDTPLYYYATGKGNSLSYEMLYVLFPKEKPRASKIAKNNKVKVLGRVDGYITRQDGYGNTAGVVRLRAVALADRTQNKDFYLSDAPSAALYTSWKEGKLFFEESAEQVLSRFPQPTLPSATQEQKEPLPPQKTKPAPAPQPAKEKKPQPPAGIVFDPEDPPFILFPPKEPAEEPAPQEETSAKENTLTEQEQTPLPTPAAAQPQEEPLSTQQPAIKQTPANEEAPAQKEAPAAPADAPVQPAADSPAETSTPAQAPVPAQAEITPADNTPPSQEKTVLPS